MRRGGLIAGIVLVIGLNTPVSAQPWADDLFEKKSHDFGVVARASKAEHLFEATNPLDEEIRFRSVRASCGCASPSIVQQTLGVGETGGVLVKLNSRSFVGRRRATITVTIDRPRYAEIQLHIAGYVRRDFVLDPGEVDFGRVTAGSAAERKIDIRYAGQDDWKLTDVKSTHPHVEARWEELNRERGRVHYELSVRLSDEAEPGYLNEELVLTTNDRLSDVRLMVEGRVVAPLTLSPASLFMGVVPPGGQVTKMLVLKADSAFRITDVRCDKNRLQVELPTEAKKIHLLPIRLTASDREGAVRETVQFLTDMNAGETVGCVVTATVKSQGP